MKIALAADHAGFKLKEEIKTYLQAEGHECLDFGTNNEERSDYPDFAIAAAQAVAKGGAERGILVCGSGIGVCMTANRIRGVRAAVLRIPEDARLSRQHNDANVACLGGRLTSFNDAKTFITLFLNTPFEGGRHIARIQKMDR